MKKKINNLFPGMEVEILTRNSEGDLLQNIPLQTMEGTDFFTREIFNALREGEADIAVHSLKDMSHEHFKGGNFFAVTERDDSRDVAIFRAEVGEKIRKKETIIVGTCSPRREEMAVGFLQKALPFGEANIVVKPIRGNVDTRLRKLEAGEYDGILLAAAGLNRLLSDKENSPAIRSLLADKKLMLLPLIECAPAPCQGAIVAEAYPGNQHAVNVLQAINDQELFDECLEEKETAIQYGAGCQQQFGVTTIHYGKNAAVYAAGRNAQGIEFSQWKYLPELDPGGKTIFSSADFMGGFFQYHYFEGTPDIKEPVVFVANYKAIQPGPLVDLLKNKRVWASGTKTWFELSKAGIWVEGSADALGLEFLETVWKAPLMRIAKNDVCVLTHVEAEANWKKKGWKTASTYRSEPKNSTAIKESLKKADLVFWTSFRQYGLYKDVLKREVVHVCPSGETAALLRDTGLKPVVFPTIKAFKEWRQTFSR